MDVEQRTAHEESAMEGVWLITGRGGGLWEHGEGGKEQRLASLLTFCRM